MVGVIGIVIFIQSTTFQRNEKLVHQLPPEKNKKNNNN